MVISKGMAQEGRACNMNVGEWSKIQLVIRAQENGGGR